MTRKTPYSLLKKVVRSFMYRGFVNGLTEKQYEALGEALEYIQGVEAEKDKSGIAKRLREYGHTIREIAEIMGYKHPGSISHLLDKKEKP